MASYRGNYLIQIMCRTPEAIARLNVDPEKIFEEFGFDDQEKQAFREGSIESMGRVGVHPILQIHYLLARSPEMVELMSIAGYAPGLLEEED